MTMTQPVPHAVLRPETDAWHLTLSSALGLNPYAFQLAFGGPQVLREDADLWRLLGAVPGAGRVHDHTEQADSLPAAYLDLLDQVTLPGGALRAVLGEQWPAWQQAVEAARPENAPAWRDLFDRWSADQALTPAQRQTGARLLAVRPDRPVLDSTRPAPSWSDVPAFAPDLSGVQAALGRQARQAHFTLDTTGSAGRVLLRAAGRPLLWAGPLDLCAEIQLGAVAVVPVQPGAWLNKTLLRTALDTRTAPVWRSGTPGWRAWFGAQGRLSQWPVSVVVAGGVQAVVSSRRAFSTDQQARLRAERGLSVAPFHTGVPERLPLLVDFDRTGRLVAALHTDRPFVLGINYQRVQGLG